jgi:hypothetical protein
MESISGTGSIDYANLERRLSDRLSGFEAKRTVYPLSDHDCTWASLAEFIYRPPG